MKNFAASQCLPTAFGTKPRSPDAIESICAEFGFDGDVRNAGYIATWIDLLKSDKRAFFTACSKAQAAADYLRGSALAAPVECAA
jgi:antirestriction protein ArdC